ncbi:MAG: T9SS type A sorting domain-containing protein [Fimbriimonadaceae bacterium]|nr:T9SS type A sorting domain-containing protein [Chitinophagales bacterium]
MKNFTLYIFMLFSWHISVSQNFCDSTFSICDSITIDTDGFYDDSIYGDRIFFTIQTNHHSLYAPSFIVCPTDESILFEDPSYGFFGINGPSAVHIMYYFEEFDITGLPELSGRIINDNSNNEFPHCELPFNMVINGTDAITDAGNDQDILMFPNPAAITINIIPMHTAVKNVKTYDVTGKGYTLPANGSVYNIDILPTGMYVLFIELENSEIIAKKMMKE